MMTVLGIDLETNDMITLDQEARSRGIYVIGSTGTGKTTLLQSIAYQDMKAGHGLCVLDPHGDMIDWLLERVPPERVDDVILFDPGDSEFPLGLNILACDQKDPNEVRWVVSTLQGTLKRIFHYSWGPLLEHVLGHTLWTAMKIDGASILEVYLLLTNDEFREKNTKNINDTFLKNFRDEIPSSNKPKQKMDYISSTLNKLTPFLLDPDIRNIVGQSSSSFDISKIMEEGKILLVNLAKGKLGEQNSSLLGAFIINLILIAALSRYKTPSDIRQENPFHVIVDEYQNFASESFSVLQSEARKYAVDLIVAHQFRDQLTEENKGSALNVGNFISFRVTGVDGPDLARQFDNTPPPGDLIWEPIRKESRTWTGYFDRGNVDYPVPGPRRLYSDVMLEKANELSNLPLFNARARLIQKDENGDSKLGEYKMVTINPNDNNLAREFYGIKDEKLPDYIREKSRLLTESKEIISRKISERLERTGGEILTHETRTD